MRIAVCDDLPEERARLVLMLEAFFKAKALPAAFSQFDSGEALLSAYAPGAVDLLFLDIYMNQMTGVETARRLKASDPACVLIFTTASREHGADAFDTDAFHYLVKPVEKEKLFSVMNRWYDGFCQVRTMAFKSGRTTREVFVRDILYIDVQGRNSTVHTLGENFETALSLSVAESLLPAEEFVRPIRYCLVALGHIRSIRDDGVALDSGETLPLSRLEKENVRQRLAAYRLRRLRGR